ncbi:four helix bundle protein, partial [Candidatus Berkelbacteria bacterium CG08_land_8_20_14_0_20_39_8]
RYGLCSQLGRSVNSVGANIAESCGRFHYKDRTNFLYHARASLYETMHHLVIANKLKYISNKQLSEISNDIQDLNIRLNNYIASTKNNNH